MRIVFIADTDSANGWYRSLGPIAALCQRGHEGRELDLDDAGGWPALLGWCDVLHIHRSCREATVQCARAAHERGAAIVWDDDDDMLNLPKNSVIYRQLGGFRAEQRRILRQKLFALADLVTTPSRRLAAAFREAGASHTVVLENYVVDGHVPEPAPAAGDRVVVGWHAGLEHQLDLEHVPVREALQRLLDTHPDVVVKTVGLGLGLSGERYEKVPAVRFEQLLGHVGSFDVGIAPLAGQVHTSHARSNVKLKEYAVMGVPWLASPIGPYAEMGEQQGGRLVSDDRWYEELEAVVSRGRTRRKLAKEALRWGRHQTLGEHVGAWEAELTAAIERRRAAPGAAV